MVTKSSAAALSSLIIIFYFSFIQHGSFLLNLATIPFLVLPTVYVLLVPISSALDHYVPSPFRRMTYLTIVSLLISVIYFYVFSEGRYSIVLLSFFLFHGMIWILIYCFTLKIACTLSAKAKKVIAIVVPIFIFVMIPVCYVWGLYHALVSKG